MKSWTKKILLAILIISFVPQLSIVDAKADEPIQTSMDAPSGYEISTGIVIGFSLFGNGVYVIDNNTGKLELCDTSIPVAVGSTVKVKKKLNASGKPLIIDYIRGL